jgi:hypothetical protein
MVVKLDLSPYGNNIRLRFEFFMVVMSYCNTTWHRSLEDLDFNVD